MEGQSQAASSPPLIWLLMGDRVGDNSQVLGLGEALGWPLEQKSFVYTRFEKIVNMPFCAHLRGIVRGRSSKLECPWPDLVISAGRKNEPIARYIRRRADKPVRLIHMGRPWARLDKWDLVITTPQYRLPNDPNILHNDAPLHRVTRERLDLAAESWRDRVADLPGPRVVVLAGGNSGPYPFDRASGERLAEQADALAKRLGGSILVTTSARTLEETTEALFSGIESPSILYRWKKDDPDNPFFAFLGLADHVVVTADSVSMMAEACATGKPVYLFDTGEGRTSMQHNPWLDGESTAAGSAIGQEESGAIGINRWHLKAHVYRMTMRLGPQRLTRDIRIVQKLLVETNRAVWIGDGHPSDNPRPLEDISRAVERVRQLFALPSNASEPSQAASGATRSSTSNASCRT